MGGRAHLQGILGMCLRQSGEELVGLLDTREGALERALGGRVLEEAEVGVLSLSDSA